MKGPSVRIFLPRLAPDLFSRVFQTLDLIGQLHLALLQLVLEFLKFYLCLLSLQNFLPFIT